MLFCVCGLDLKHPTIMNFTLASETPIVKATPAIFQPEHLAALAEQEVSLVESIIFAIWVKNGQDIKESEE